MNTDKKIRMRITDEIETEMEKWTSVVGGEVVVVVVVDEVEMEIAV